MGVLLLLLGVILLAVSRSATVIPPQRVVTQPKETINHAGAYSLSVQDNFNSTDVFKVDFTISTPSSGIRLPENVIAVYTNITDPSGNVTQVYVEETPSSIGTWLTTGGNWNLTALANSTGVYGVSIFPEMPIIKFSRLAVSGYHVEPGKILYPYSSFFYGGLPVVGLSLALSVFGAFAKTKRVRRIRRMSVRQSGG